MGQTAVKSDAEGKKHVAKAYQRTEFVSYFSRRKWLVLCTLGQPTTPGRWHINGIGQHLIYLMH